MARSTLSVLLLSFILHFLDCNVQVLCKCVVDNAFDLIIVNEHNQECVNIPAIIYSLFVMCKLVLCTCVVDNV